MNKRWTFRMLVVAGAFVVGMGSSAAFALTPTIVVTPNTGLINLQKVKVTGKNFAPNKSLFVVECNPKVTTQKQLACDIKTGQFLTTKSSATGTVSVVFTIRTGIIGTGAGAAPCGHLHPCLLTVSPGTATGSATAKISFK
jgi:hypothetical protein